MLSKIPAMYVCCFHNRKNIIQPVDAFGGVAEGMEVEATGGSNIEQDYLAETARVRLDLQKNRAGKKACQVEGHE